MYVEVFDIEEVYVVVFCGVDMDVLFMVVFFMLCFLVLD